LLNGHMEFTPVDEAAKAIMTIARHFSTEFTVFHINTPKTISVAKLTEYFRMFGYSIDAVYGTNFETALKQTANQSGMEHIFEAFVNDMDENGHLNYDSNIRIENDFTVQYLKMLGFEELFDHIIVCGELGVEKPELLPFEEMSRVLGIPPSQLMYVGDHPLNDVDASRRAGYIPVWVRTTGSWEFPELPLPRHRVNAVYELLEYDFNTAEA